MLTIYCFLVSFFPYSWGSCNQTNRVMFIQQVTEPALHAEGPHWDSDSQSLLYVDIAGKTLHRYFTKTNEHKKAVLNSTVGFAIPVEGTKNKFAIGYGRNLSILTWDEKLELNSIISLENNYLTNRINDGKADPSGGLWFGTMHESILGNGNFYHWTPNCSVEKVLSNISISNGITWNKNKDKMFYIDSKTFKVDIFDYNGKAENRRPFFDFKSAVIEGEPDGMTIDREDNLWVAVFGSSLVVKISPSGKLLQKIRMPATRVTSVAWGDFDYSTLYVTTMRNGLTENELLEQPSAGAVFAIKGLGTAGLPANSVSKCILEL